MSSKYAWIVFKEGDGGNQQQDQNFYETLIYFCGKVLQQAFDKTDIPKLEEELNRLFRSNAFNISQRKIFEESRTKKYPQLKEPQGKESLNEMIKRLESKSKVPREQYRQSYLREKTEIRPLYTRMTPHGAINTRSPLISLLFPSPKDKIRIFEEECKKKAIKDNRSMIVKPNELSKIFEEENDRRTSLN